MAAAGLQDEKFFAGAVGFDSWATVYLIHQNPDKESERWTSKLRLAWGTCPCSLGQGRKGIPICKVEQRPGEDNIDLLPLGWFYQRGCDFMMFHSGQQLRTPKSTIEVHLWGSLPYITAQGCNKLFKELPNRDTPGQDGKPASPVARGARAARAVPQTAK